MYPYLHEQYLSNGWVSTESKTRKESSPGARQRQILLIYFFVWLMALVIYLPSLTALRSVFPLLVYFRGEPAKCFLPVLAHPFVSIIQVKKVFEKASVSCFY